MKKETLYIYGTAGTITIYGKGATVTIYIYIFHVVFLNQRY